MVVSAVFLFIPDLYTDGWVVVKMLRKGECFDTGEDSDCDTTPEQTSGFTLEVQHGWTVPESLPVLTTGSFARYEYSRL